MGENDQVGVTGRPLPDPITIQVTGLAPDSEVPGVAVLFEVISGGGSLSSTRAVTNPKGNALTRYTLGPAEGANQIVARLEIDPDKEIVVQATAVGPPRVDAVEPDSAAPGDTVTVRGANFSPIARHNDVFFGARAATPFAASASTLRVEVPPLAITGPVTVELTGVRSNELAYELAPAEVTARDPGSVELVSLPDGDGEILLPFADPSQEFTLVVQSLTPTDATFTAQIQGASAQFARGRLLGSIDRAGIRDPEERIRDLERRLLPSLPRRAIASPRGLAPAQEVGSTDTFRVANKLGSEFQLDDEDDFTKVTATLKFVGENTLLYVDDQTPAANAPQSLLDAIGRQFDDRTHPTNASVFGPESDVDGNDKVIILMTPVVNGLTSREDFEERRQFVAGFFFAIDLFPDPTFNPFANGAEIFYSVVPDPSAVFGPVELPPDRVDDLLNSVFAHEHQHMIAANFHLVRNTACQSNCSEALWLAEGLSHMAEAVNGFFGGNQVNATLFLDEPERVTLVAAEGLVDERGAAWLFVQSMVDRFGQQILASMVQTTRRGIDNVENASGETFGSLFHAWSVALLLDGTGLNDDPRFDLPSVALREIFERIKSDFPDLPVTGPYLGIGSGRSLPGTTVSVSQKGTSAAYLRFTSELRANIPVDIDGAAGADLRVAVIRTK